MLASVVGLNEFFNLSIFRLYQWKLHFKANFTLCDEEAKYVIWSFEASLKLSVAVDAQSHSILGIFIYF